MTLTLNAAIASDTGKPTGRDYLGRVSEKQDDCCEQRDLLIPPSINWKEAQKEQRVGSATRHQDDGEHDDEQLRLRRKQERLVVNDDPDMLPLPKMEF